MTDKQKEDKGQDGMNPIVAGATGAVIGLGIAVAGAAVVLNDKKNRGKVKEALISAKDEALSYVKDIQKKTQDKKSKVKKVITQDAKKAKKTVQKKKIK